MVKKVWLYTLALVALFECCNTVESKANATVYTIPLLLEKVSVKESINSIEGRSHSAPPGLSEKLGNLIALKVYEGKEQAYYSQIDEWVSRHNIGAIWLESTNATWQASMSRRLNKLSNQPLLIVAPSPLGNTKQAGIPSPQTLGALPDPNLLNDIGIQLANRARQQGVSMFVPQAYNQESKITSYNTGLTHAYKKEEKEVALIASQREHNTLTCLSVYTDRVKGAAWQLPEHLTGDAPSAIFFTQDREKTPVNLTTVTNNIAALDTGQTFSGLIMADAIAYYDPGSVEVIDMLAAGADIVVLDKINDNIHKHLKRGLRKRGDLKKKLENRARRIQQLRVNQLIGSPPKLTKNNTTANPLPVTHKIHRSAITMTRNSGNQLPVRHLEGRFFASLALGTNTITKFQSQLERYAPINHFYRPMEQLDHMAYNELLQALKHYDQVIISWHPPRVNLSEAQKKKRNEAALFLEALAAETQTTVVLFGPAQDLKYLTANGAQLCAYEDNPVTQSVSAQIIFGALSPSGKLPMAVGSLPYGAGMSLETLDRLSYGIPEEEKMDSKTLARIDKVVEDMIKRKMAPGCQVLIARNGKVVWDKNYGYLTYDSLSPVVPSTIYDLASITKVMGTLQAVMFLTERGLIDLKKPIDSYLTELKGTNKANMVIEDILLHQAGLLPYIPFWRKTVSEEGLADSLYYRTFPMNGFNVEVGPGLYTLNQMEDSLWHWTANSNLRRKPRGKKGYDYKYSDMGYYMLKRLSEKLLNQSIEDFLGQNFYEPLGLSTMCYLPLCRFPVERIAPTEDDRYFRNTLVLGTVHDQGAAMLGGVGGHAGLFSNANDLAVMMQMHLQDGSYGGKKYLLPGTLRRFTKKQTKENRRGLGWDKPLPGGGGPTGDKVSLETYGHTGFTGTAAWADPAYGLVFIFLSNRIYPDANNRKLITTSVRTRIQDIIYESMYDYSP